MVSKITKFFFIDTGNITPDPDANWAKIQDPDPSSMCLDPQQQHWSKFRIFSSC